MKASDGGTTKSIIEQLEGARCFVIYCKEIGITFWGKQEFLRDYEFRFLSITNIKEIKLKKTKTIIDKNNKNTHTSSSGTKLIHRNGNSFKFPDLIYNQQ